MLTRNLPRIVIDARSLSHPQAGGFQTSVRTLLKGLVETEEAGEASLPAKYLLYLDRPLPINAKPLPSFIEIRILSPNRLRSDLILFRKQVQRDAPDLVHGTANYLPPLPVQTTLTIHDALGIKNYGFTNSFEVRRSPREIFIYRYTRWMTRQAAGAASRIATDSQASALDLGGALKFSQNRFTVVYHGIALPLPYHDENRPLTASHTVLALASPDPRKNLQCLYRTLSKERHRFARLPHLQVICANQKLAQSTEAALRKNNVSDYTLVRGLEDAALANTYAASDAFVFPSRWEGFGLPPLEAMQSGCPVVASNAPALPEVLGDIPLYFDPEQPGELAEVLNRLLNNPTEQQERREQGRRHAAKFTCRRMAEQMQALWQEALNQ